MKIECVSTITGIGASIPDQVVTSEDLMFEAGSTRFGTPENYISQNIGIKERRWANEGCCPSDLAISASEYALKDAKVCPKDVQLVVYCAIDRDWREPSTAHRIQSELGCENAICFDVSNACLGVMNGIAIADSFIARGAIDTALVCTGETPSHITKEALRQLKATNSKPEFRRKLGALTVGDAGGALVIQRAQSSGFTSLRFRSAGEHAELCYYKQTSAGMDGQMLMREIGLQIVKLHKSNINKTYEELGWEPENVERVYCHQVGAKPHIALVNAASQNVEKAPITYENFGNLTSATFPVLLFLNRPSKGERIMFLGTGSGLSIVQGGMVF